IVVLGGLGSVVGTAAAALILALVEVFAILALPSYLTGAVGFVLLVLVLVFRSGGLFGQRVLGCRFCRTGFRGPRLARCSSACRSGTSCTVCSVRRLYPVPV